MAEVFDDSRLDDEAALARADPVLRPLAEAGCPGPPRGGRRRRGDRGGRRRRRSASPARAPWSPPAPTPGCCARCSSRGARCRSWPGPGPSLPGWAGGARPGRRARARGQRHRRRVRGRRGGPPRLPRRGRLPAAARWSPSTPSAATARCCPCSSGDQLATAVVMLRVPRPARPRARTPTPSRWRRPSTTWRSPARRTATSPSTPPRCWPSRWPTPPRWCGAGRCSPPAPPAGSPSRSGGPAAAPRWPATPSTCCR